MSTPYVARILILMCYRTPNSVILAFGGDVRGSKSPRRAPRRPLPLARCTLFQAQLTLAEGAHRSERPVAVYGTRGLLSPTTQQQMLYKKRRHPVGGEQRTDRDTPRCGLLQYLPSSFVQSIRQKKFSTIRVAPGRQRQRETAVTQTPRLQQTLLDPSTTLEE